MKIEHVSKSTIQVKLPNGKGFIIMYNEKSDELSLGCIGEGHRNIKQVQNRSDGYSGLTLTKQE